MNLTEKIFDLLQKNTPLAEIESAIDWSALTQTDFELLLSEAELMYGSRL
jgi:hypothetical protein